MTGYAELQVTTNFSFLRGGAHPEELALTARALGLTALAITDRNSLAGAVRLHAACRAHGVRAIIGARLDLSADADGSASDPGPSAGLLVHVRDRAGYAALTRTLTVGQRRAPKGACYLTRADIAALAAEAGSGLAFTMVPPLDFDDAALKADLVAWRACLAPAGPVHLALSQYYRGDDRRRLARLSRLAAAAGLQPLATNDVLYHSPARRRLQDVLTCIRLGCTIDDAGWALEANAERHLKGPDEMARLFAEHPEALANARALAAACRFSLAEIAYSYPDESTSAETSQQRLERLAWAGAQRRYPGGVPDGVRASIARELAIIARLGYADYFLTVERIVAFARGRGILCQGRGSAANSAVCYCLGITAVDPARSRLLFERFVSEERGEPPDIDVDFEHERREEVIQHIYETYGRHRAALAATVICYRARGALREVGKAMGLSADVLERFNAGMWGSKLDDLQAAARDNGLDPSEPRLALTLELAEALIGFPRHLSQHVGGFVIARDRVDSLVPVGNAAMDGRTIIEWDKDDLESLGLLKIDVLALGMLSCLRRGLDLLRAHYGRHLSLATIPAEDPAVFDMLCRADSMGVFQVESRAQMNMLPRLRPQEYYDLVVEVAIVRPGPIQGDMVHPYLKRRQGREPVTYPSEELRAVLGKTLGVPLFQEQAMQIAITAAGFTPAEADQLRRAMATFRKGNDLGPFRQKLVEGMVANGYDRGFAERCFQQIEGFGTYGFPESHAASFALLVYVSAWLKRHYPDVFCCALLNSQPLGFYAPAQLIRDARAHGVVVRPVCVGRSGWDNALEEPAGRDGYRALRLGLRQVQGLGPAAAQALVAARPPEGYRDVADVARRTGLSSASLTALAHADAFAGLGYDRRQALWAVHALPAGVAGLPLFAAAEEAGHPVPAREPGARLPAMSTGEAVLADYTSQHLSLRAHPMALLGRALDADLAAAARAEGLTPQAITRADRLAELGDGAAVAVAGIVTVRQRPGSAKGVVFVTLEDIAESCNVAVMPDIFAAYRRRLIAGRLLGVLGKLEVSPEGIIHVRARHVLDLSASLMRLGAEGPAAAADLPRGGGDEVGQNRPAPQEIPFPSHDFH